MADMKEMMQAEEQRLNEESLANAQRWANEKNGRKLFAELDSWNEASAAQFSPRSPKEELIEALLKEQHKADKKFLADYQKELEAKKERQSDMPAKKEKAQKKQADLPIIPMRDSHEELEENIQASGAIDIALELIEKEAEIMAAPIEHIEDEKQIMPLIEIQKKEEKLSDLRLKFPFIEGPIDLGLAKMPEGYEKCEIPAGWRIYHNSASIEDSNSFYPAKKLESGEWAIYGRKGDIQRANSLQIAWGWLELKRKYNEAPRRDEKAMPWPADENEDYYILRCEISPERKKAIKAEKASQEKPAKKMSKPEMAGLANSINLAAMAKKPIHCAQYPQAQINIAYSDHEKLFLSLIHEDHEIKIECNDEDIASLIAFFNSKPASQEKAS